MPAIEEFYHSLSKQVGYVVVPEEAQVNNAAYEVLQVTGNSELAKKIFEFNQRNYPESPNSYAGLSRVFLVERDYSRATNLIKKAISLVEKNDNRYQIFIDQLSNVEQLTKSEN